MTWQHVSAKQLKGAELDPLWETADADRGNNVYEGAITPTTFKISKPPETSNRMKDADLEVGRDSLATRPGGETKKAEGSK